MGNRPAGTLHERSAWRPATVVSVIAPASEETAEGMIALTVRPDKPLAHTAGQYCDLRFPGEHACRAFSIITPPSNSDDILEFGISVLPAGLISPRLAACASGDRLEIRGPVGRAFTWSPENGFPLVLIGAGAGITPLLSMYDHAAGSNRQTASGTPAVIFLASARTPQRLFRYSRYRHALLARFTESEPRIDRTFLARHLAAVPGAPCVAARVCGGSRSAPSLTDSGTPRVAARVCGPGGFRATIIDALLELGVPPERIRSEGFT